MRKLLCSLALCAATGVLIACVSPTAPARPKDKSDEKKDEKKDAKKDVKAVEPGTIEVYQSKDGWRYRVLGADGKPIAIGVQGYAKKEDCLATVEILKATLTKAKVVEIGGK
ncbi:YegP family protein [Frigoriglobus tundricola]|uniref:DUF1508 domain-containing protein n=1 Tax=Frigoriglobus tundricola TaxID=2774151 RepID=A0A6M5YYV4_9BACT|nr:hypothetical protein [Frigoriglobus tundricola]QJW99209.1 hypothetical protein FTUN_6809 [Frigoriglobus tundricola]